MERIKNSMLAPPVKPQMTVLNVDQVDSSIELSQNDIQQQMQPTLGQQQLSPFQGSENSQFQVQDYHVKKEKSSHMGLGSTMPPSHEQTFYN